MKIGLFKRITGIIITLSMALSLFPVVNVSAASGFTKRTKMDYEDTQLKYYIYNKSYAKGNGFPRNYSLAGGNCTWYAFGRAWEILGKHPNLCWNNAAKWYNYNKENDYYPYGNTPQVGAIAVWSGGNGGAGHVAVVEEVGSDYVMISHSGWSFKDEIFKYEKYSLKNGAIVYYSGFKFLGYIYILNDPNVHIHSWEGSYEAEHPHKYYEYCTSCKKKIYPGGKKSIKSCPKCYPLGAANLKRSYQKTKGTVTFKRNNVKNATNYTLTIKKDNNSYGTYDMPNTSLSLSGLESGTYTATLYIKNDNTGEPKTAKYDSFTMVNSYAITYDANGGTDAPSSQSKIKDVDLTLSSSIPSREGYDFLGWSRTKKATEPEYTAGGKFTLNTKVTLYAVWTPKTYTVSFDVNGGNGDTESVSITHGNVIRMPNNIVRNSYYLKGWAKTNDAQTPDYRLGMDYAVTSDMALYAVWGQSTWDNGTEPFAGGDGTVENPYQIANSKQLAYLADKVNNQQSEPIYEYYILTDNINLGYQEWKPIGIYENNNQFFKGSFNGNGYTISNLKITSLNNGYIGLFGYTKDSEIKNLNISGRINGINSKNGIIKVGAIAGYSSNLIADNCKGMNINVSDISSTASSENEKYSHVGAMFGYAVNESKIVNCLAKDCFVGVTKGLYRIGVIVGGANGSIIDCHVISDEELLGSDSTVEEVFCGGIAGSISGQIKTSDVEAKYLSVLLQTTGKLYAGGLVGWLNSGTVECCAVKFTDGLERPIDDISYKVSIFGKTTASTGTNYSVVGGVVGVSKVTATISDCKYEGNSLVSTSGGMNAYVGGLIGYDNGTDSNIVGINRCFANVDGIVYAEAPNTTGAGGAIGRIGIAESVESTAQNIITKANRVSAKTTINSKYANAGSIFANRTYNTYSFSNVASWSSMVLSSINTEDSNKANIQYTGSKWTGDYFKTKTELSTIFGIPYESVAMLKENPESVWVIKDGQYPELYFTVLRDITLSDVEHGAISVDKTQAVDDEIVTVTAEPDEGYALGKIYVNGEKITGTTFEVKGDSEVYATFAEIPAEYSVEVKAAENAAASLTNVDEMNLQSVSLFSTTTSLTATDGEEIRVDTQSDEDYNVEAVYVNGEEMASDSFIVTDNSVITMDVKNVSTDIKATTYDATNIKNFSATLSGNVEGDDDTVSRYIRYWSTETPDEVYTTEVEEGSGEYSVDIVDLEAITEYQYQMADTGEIKTFTTTNLSGYEDIEYNEEPIQREICFNIQNQSKGKFSISADVVNETDEVQSGLVVYAAYDGNGALVKVEAETITGLAANGTFPVEFAIADGAEKYKILVWDSWKTMLPIAPSVDIE